MKAIDILRKFGRRWRTMEALYLMKDEKFIYKKRIADKLGVNASVAVKIFDFLKKEGYIREKTEEPIRGIVRFFEITEKGLKTIKLLDKEVEEE